MLKNQHLNKIESKSISNELNQFYDQVLSVFVLNLIYRLFSNIFFRKIEKKLGDFLVGHLIVCDM